MEWGEWLAAATVHPATLIAAGSAAVGFLGVVLGAAAAHLAFGRR